MALKEEVIDLSDQYRTIVDNMDQAICIIDNHCQIVFCNKKFEISTNLRTGDSFKELCRVSGKKSVPKPSRVKSEFEIEVKFPKRTFSIVNTPMKIQDKEYFLEEVRDISRVKSFECALEDYTEKLEKEIERKTEDLRNKVKSSEQQRAALINMMDDLNRAYKTLEEEDVRKDELFDITSHELKTPLVPISGFIDVMLKDSANMTKIQKGYLQIIHNNIFRLKNLLDNVLEISRLQARKADFKLTLTDISKIIKEEVSSSGRKARDKQIKVMPFNSKPLKIRCDPEKMRQVIKHLLDNAIKFNKMKGTIKISLLEKKDKVLIKVENDGATIPKEAKNKIFDKFYQVDSSLNRETCGAGLGLAVCRAVITAHRGTIWVEPEKKKTVFYVELPMNLKKTKDISDIYGSNMVLLANARKKLGEERMEVFSEL